MVIVNCQIELEEEKERRKENDMMQHPFTHRDTRKIVLCMAAGQPLLCSYKMTEEKGQIKWHLIISKTVDRAGHTI